jgi:phosphopantothenoylcysteine decarboxylase/phosphopantothenate--cysteine ligase
MSEIKRVLLIVSGGIAAYKSVDVIRRLRERGHAVRCILTQAGAEFVTPLSLGALSGDKVYDHLFSLTDESEMGHIELSRAADLVLVAPATASILAKMAAGIADDLATTALLATDCPVMVAPAMNVRMWEHSATQANMAALEARGVMSIGPDEGDMACGEWGLGRLAEANAICAAVENLLSASGRLSGRRALVTSGPTHESLDPVRYLANRSSGKQGHAIARAFSRLGADTVLVSGPTGQPDPAGVETVHVETAAQMLEACEKALPVDAFVAAAAVTDWRIASPAADKIKKGKVPALELVENPDILALISGAGNRRPDLVIGFAAETSSVVENAVDKRHSKGCDWIVANDVSAGTGILGGDSNTVQLVTSAGVEDWPSMSKDAVAERLTLRIADALDEAS